MKAKAADPGSFRDNPDEVALKTHSEVRAEASLLKDLEHPNLIRFVGLSLKPLAIVLEWAPKKGMRKVLADYCKADARLSPATLQETARQVGAAACGVSVGVSVRVWVKVCGFGVGRGDGGGTRDSPKASDAPTSLKHCAICTVIAVLVYVTLPWWEVCV